MELMGTSLKIDLYSHPLFLRMVNEHGFESCDKDTFPQFLQKPGLSMVVFIEDPNRMKETTRDCAGIGKKLRLDRTQSSGRTS